MSKDRSQVLYPPEKMKQRFFYFCAILCAGCFLLDSFLCASEPIQVLSINVRLSTGKDGEDVWANRQDFMMDVVKSIPYDFIGGQEVVIAPEDKINQYKFMQDRLPGYGSVFRSREKSEAWGEGTPVFYRKDRWEPDADEMGVYWLSDTPNVPGSVTWKGQSQCPRVVTGGLFHEKEKDGKRTGKSVYFYSTHFDHVGEIARQKAANLILEKIAQRKDKTIPVILVGDFNAGENSPTIRFLKGETVELDGETKTPPIAMTDSFRQVHPTESKVATFHGFKGEAYQYNNVNEVGAKIDYIFVTPDLKSISAEIIRTKNERNRYPSDHYPIRSVVGFE